MIVKVGKEIFVEKLLPAWHAFASAKEVNDLGLEFTRSIRKEGLTGFVIAKHHGWVESWLVRHTDGSFGVYLPEELNIITLHYWYMVKRMYGYR